MVIKAKRFDMASQRPHTTTIVCAGVAYVGMELQDPNNLAQRDDEAGVVFTSAKPIEGYRFNTRSHSRAHLTPRDPSTQSKEAAVVTSPKPTSVGTILRTPAVFPTPQPTLVAAERLSPFSSHPVSLLVGGANGTTPAVTLIAHEELLVNLSPFFAAALGRFTDGTSFAEAETGVIHMPDDRPDDMSMLLQWAYWRALVEKIQPASNNQSASTAHSASIPPSVTTAVPSTKPASPSSTTTTPTTTPAATTLSPLHHPLIDRPLQRYASYFSEKRLIRTTFGPSSPEYQTFKTKRKRPRPPCFAPLVRLYILADKYHIAKGRLAREVTERVEWVGREGKCVLRREEVGMLWNGVVDAKCRIGGLKRAVLGMFVGMNGRSMRGLFAVEDEDEGGGVDGDAFGGGGSSSSSDDMCADEGEEEAAAAGWHPGFMRDLLLALVDAREEAVKVERERGSWRVSKTVQNGMLLEEERTVTTTTGRTVVEDGNRNARRGTLWH